MKILYVVIDGKVSGGNHICAAILKQARQAGHQVELLTPSLGPLTESLKKDSVTIHTLNLSRSFYIHQSIRLARLLKGRKIDLVHTHTTLNPEILCRIACALAGIPIICHQHDPVDLVHSNPLVAFYQRAFDRLSSFFVNRFIAVSKYRHDAMVKVRGYKPSQVHLIYNGIDIKRFASQNSREEVRREWRLEMGEIAVGLIGRLEPSKGQETLIEAIPLVLNQFPKTRFFLIGGDHGPEQPSLLHYQRLIHKLGLEPFCFLLGFRDDMERLLHGLDLVVLPSLWEGHPLVLLEAMAAKKPVIASRVGGTPEIIDHEENGLLIPAQDPNALAAAICRLIQNPKFSDVLVRDGFEKVSRNFDHKHMIDRVFEVYHQINSMAVPS